jgi:two-component system chemotaxis response regulator CheB
VTKIRVLVVEDSLTVRRQLCEVITGDPGLDLVGEAADGQQAIDLCTALRPDVISMDMMMPGVTGLAATEHIMAHTPTPILVVSASVNRGELFETYEALAAGAVDVIEKPRGDEPEGVWERNYLATLRLVSRIRVITHPRARLAPRTQPPRTAPTKPPASTRVIAIGASTGGPGAVVTVLRSLPPKLTCPILLVVHLSEAFAPAFAEWLDTQSPHRVRLATDGLALGPGVTMAPPARHMVLAGNKVRLTDDSPRHSCKPSVDTMFESVARECGTRAIAALLTGMGRDGAAGLLAIRKTGGHTIAQDEATSVVFGMPREAILLDAANRVLPLDAIGPAISAFVEVP